MLDVYDHVCRQVERLREAVEGDADLGDHARQSAQNEKPPAIGGFFQLVARPVSIFLIEAHALLPECQS